MPPKFVASGWVCGRAISAFVIAHLCLLVRATTVLSFPGPSFYDSLQVSLAAEPTGDAIAGILKRCDHPDRLIALKAIQEVGPDARAVVPTLLSLLDDEDPDIRLCSLHAFEE